MQGWLGMCGLSIKTNLNKTDVDEKKKDLIKRLKQTRTGEATFYTPTEQFSAFFEPTFVHVYSITKLSSLTVISLVKYTLVYFPIICILVAHLSTDL